MDIFLSPDWEAGDKLKFVGHYPALK